MHHHHLVLREAALEVCFLLTQRKKSFFKIQWVQEFSTRKTTLGIFCAKCLQPHGLKIRDEKRKKCTYAMEERSGNRRWGKYFFKENNPVLLYSILFEYEYV